MTWFVSYPTNNGPHTTPVDGDEHAAEQAASRAARAHNTTATYWWADIDEETP